MGDAEQQRVWVHAVDKDSEDFDRLYVRCGVSRHHAARPPTNSAPNARRSWVGQLTKIDKSGYNMAIVPMLLRVERDPECNRMVPALALGDPPTVTARSGTSELSVVVDLAFHVRAMAAS